MEAGHSYEFRILSSLDTVVDAEKYLNVVAGVEKSGALLRPQQPDEAARLVPTLDGWYHGGVLSSGRLGARTATGRQPDV